MILLQHIKELLKTLPPNTMSYFIFIHDLFLEYLNV